MPALQTGSSRAWSGVAAPKVMPPSPERAMARVWLLRSLMFCRTAPSASSTALLSSVSRPMNAPAFQVMPTIVAVGIARRYDACGIARHQRNQEAAPAGLKVGAGGGEHGLPCRLFDLWREVHRVRPGGAVIIAIHRVELEGSGTGEGAGLPCTESDPRRAVRMKAPDPAALPVEQQRGIAHSSFAHAPDGDGW